MSDPVRSDPVRTELRLRPPQTGLTPGLVRRRRLEERLSQGTAGRVTLVCAAAGAGKTSAIAAWLTSEGAAGSIVAWMTLDDTDNDLPRFWADLITALGVAGALPAGSSLAELAPTAGFGTAELLVVWAGLAALPGPVVLVLDDFHEVTDAAVLDSVQAVLDHQGTNLHVVISTRTEPPLRLHRQRLPDPKQEQLTEIRSEDLAFTDTEAAELFDHSGLRVSAMQRHLLLDRTLGWSAGLRMAALSLDAADIDIGIARFSGAQGSVAGYLIDEVVERLPVVDRDFLLRTSVADRLNGALACVLSGRSDGRLVLEKLVGANAFVVRFGGRGEWFGYHPLFREMLQHRLSQENPDLVRVLHRLAATWFEENDEPIEGIRHAIRAQAWDELTSMLTASFHLVLSSDGPDLVAALEPVAARADDEDPPLCALLAAALCHYYRRDFHATRRDIRRAAELLPAAAAAVRPAAAVLIALERNTYGRSVDVATLGKASADLVALVDRTAGRDLPAAAYYRVVGTNGIAVSQVWSGEFAVAQVNLTEALAQARTLGIALAGFSAEVYLALLDVLHGRLRRGHRRASDAQRSLDRRGWGSESQASAGYVALALTHLARHQLDHAAAQIDRGLAASERGTDAGCRVMLHIAAIDLAAARGGAAGIATAARHLRERTSGVGGLPDLLRRWWAVAQAEALVAVGSPAAAIDLLGAPGQASGLAGCLERVALARAHLALRAAEYAGDLLEPLLDPALPYRTEAVRARVLLAQAQLAQGLDAASAAVLAEAVNLAQYEGVVGPFVTAGASISPLLERLRHNGAAHPGFTRELLSAIGSAAG